MLIFQRVIYGIIFFILFLICLRNSTPVSFDIYVSKFNSPLIVLLFIAFILGIIAGTLAILPKVCRQNKQIKSLKQASIKADEAAKNSDNEINANSNT